MATTCTEGTVRIRLQESDCAGERRSVRGVPQLRQVHSMRFTLQGSQIVTASGSPSGIATTCSAPESVPAAALTVKAAFR